MFGLPIKSQKNITKANISCTPFDIRKSKLTMAKIKFNNFGKTYICFDFSKLGHISWENCFLERNITIGNKCNIEHSNHTLSTNCNGKFLFTIKRPSSCKKSFCFTSSFLKGSFITKKKMLHLLGHLAFYL